MKTFGVKVCCIQPGLFKTPLSNPAKIMKEKELIWNKLPLDIKKQYVRKVRQFLDICVKTSNAFLAEKAYKVTLYFLITLTFLKDSNVRSYYSNASVSQYDHPLKRLFWEALFKSQ